MNSFSKDEIDRFVREARMHAEFPQHRAHGMYGDPKLDKLNRDKKKMNVSIVTPTTFRRPELLKNAISSIVDRNKHITFSVFIVKNGIIPDDEWNDFSIENAKLYKLKTHPGGYVSRAVNAGLDLAYSVNPEHDYVILNEDDIVCTEPENWLDSLVELYKSIDDVGFINNRMHGAQQHANPPQGFRGLPIHNDNTFQVWWGDGLQICSAENLAQYRWDESLNSSGQWAEVMLRMRENGLNAYYTDIKMEHHQITGDEKLVFCENPSFHSQHGEWSMYELWKDHPDPTIRDYVEVDLRENYERKLAADGPWTVTEEKVLVFGPWIGEFNYEFAYLVRSMKAIIKFI